MGSYPRGGGGGLFVKISFSGVGLFEGGGGGGGLFESGGLIDHLR